MCLTPFWVNHVQVPCQQCWQCKEGRVRDWIGRCIAETKTSFASTVMTLTYGDSPRMNAQDNEWHATSLVYHDVKNYMKLLRYHGFPVRYFAVGEYGSRKGRAHWHIVLFWQSQNLPPLQFMKKFNHAPFWPHGFAWAEVAEPKAIRYVMKYIVKGFKDDVKTSYGLSLRPPLGANYFRELARVYVDHGLSPRDLRYSFADVLKRDGTQLPFYLKRHSAYYFLNAFDLEWQARYHNQDWPNSELMDTYVDIRDRKYRSEAKNQLEIDDNYFMLQGFSDELQGIRKHFSGEKKEWTLGADVAAIELERKLQSQKQFQAEYRVHKKAG